MAPAAERHPGDRGAKEQQRALENLSQDGWTEGYCSYYESYVYTLRFTRHISQFTFHTLHCTLFTFHLVHMRRHAELNGAGVFV